MPVEQAPDLYVYDVGIPECRRAPTLGVFSNDDMLPSIDMESHFV